MAAGLALAVPLCDAVNELIDPLTMLTIGLTLLKAKLTDRGVARSVADIMSEVNDTRSGGSLAVSVSPAPAPRAESVNVPLRKFTPVPPAPEVIENEPK